ncbi:MAG: FAD-binding oxidoreductase, partial [Pseudonocardiaceae bacterium]|nr:FAD-binding oxidoreductase [Pseudonocardiaceae bacterium]
MTVDYVIVGGGAVGCALAWQLAERGATVAVLEQAEVAAGASGGPGARGIRANGRDIRELPLVRRAQEIWPMLADRLGGPTGYRRTGGLRLVEHEVVGVRGGRVSLEAHAWAQRNAGIATRVVDRAELDHLEPGLASQVTHALLCPDDGTAEHETTTLSLAGAARHAGALVRERSCVRRLSWRGGRVTAVETDDGKFVPRRAVVLTANTGTGALLTPRVPFLPIWSVVPQLCFVRPRTPVPLRHLIGHESRTVSLKAGADGLVQVSGGWRGRWDSHRGRGVVDPRTTAKAMR